MEGPPTSSKTKTMIVQHIYGKFCKTSEQSNGIHLALEFFTQLLKLTKTPKKVT